MRITRLFYANYLIFAYVVGCALLISNQQMSWLNVAIASLLLILLFLRIGISGPIMIPRAFWLAIAFAVYICLSMFWIKDPLLGFQSLLMTGASIIGCLAILIALANGASYNYLVYGAIVGGLGVCISCLISPEFGYETRIGGILQNPNGTAVYLSIASYILICSPVKEKFKRYLIYIALAFLVFAFAYTGSRKTVPALGIFLMYIGYLAIYKQKFVTKIIVVASLIVVLMTLIFSGFFGKEFSKFFADIPSAERVVELVQGNESSGVKRLAMAKEAIDIWHKNPIFGNGFGYYIAASRSMVYSHNNYTELLANTGLVGLLLYYLQYLLPLILIKIKYHKIRPEIVAAITMVLLIDFGSVSVLGKMSWVLIAVIGYRWHIYSELTRQLHTNKSTSNGSIKKQEYL